MKKVKKVRRIRKFRIPPYSRDKAGYYYREFPIAYIKGHVRDFFVQYYKGMTLIANAKEIKEKTVKFRYIGVKMI